MIVVVLFVGMLLLLVVEVRVGVGVSPGVPAAGVHHRVPLLLLVVASVDVLWLPRDDHLPGFHVVVVVVVAAAAEDCGGGGVGRMVVMRVLEVGRGRRGRIGGTGLEGLKDQNWCQMLTSISRLLTKSATWCWCSAWKSAKILSMSIIPGRVCRRSEERRSLMSAGMSERPLAPPPPPPPVEATAVGGTPLAAAEAAAVEVAAVEVEAEVGVEAVIEAVPLGLTLTTEAEGPFMRFASSGPTRSERSSRFSSVTGRLDNCNFAKTELIDHGEI